MGEYTMLHCGTLFDGRNEELRRNWDVLIRGDEICEVGPGLQMPDGTKSVDLTDLLVTPGLIDVHVHSEFFDWRDIYTDFSDFTDEWLALGTLYTAQKALLSGFTTLRVLGSFSRGFGLVDVKRAINKGYFKAARLYVSAHGLTVSGGHGDLSRSLWKNPLLSALMQPGACGSGADFFADCVRKEAKYGADYIKILTSHDMAGDNGLDERVEFTDEELAAIFTAAHAMRLPVTAHAYSPPVMQKLIGYGVSGIEHGSLMDDKTAILMEDKGIYLVPTFAAFDELVFANQKDPSLSSRTRERIAKYRESLLISRALILNSGIRLGYGSDFVSGYNNYECWREYLSWIKSGAKPLRVLKAATSVNASILGVSDIGVISPGMRADVAAFPQALFKDPRQLGNCRFVMKEGIIVKQEEV